MGFRVSDNNVIFADYFYSGSFNRSMRKIKHIGIKKAKSDAWDAFSKYIRLRDALKTTGTKEYLICITCDKRYKAFGVGCAQAGHFLPGRGNAVLIDEKFVHGQCYNCNFNLKGSWVVFEKKMIEMWGKKAVEKAKLKKTETKLISVPEWQEIEAKYKELYELLNQK